MFASHIVGNLRFDDDDGKNAKKGVGKVLAASAAHFFAYFFDVTAKLRRDN